MDRLVAMQVFTKVVEMSGFSRASRALNLPRATATTTIKKLEAHLQVRLLHRTTRRLSLTPEGARYYEHCVRILSEIMAGEEAISQIKTGPRGQLRIDVPGWIGRQVIIPRIMEFRELYPDIELTIGFGEKSVDLIQDGVDCAIRIGEPQGLSLVRRRLGAFNLLTTASPDYTEKYGMPIVIEDLASHRAVLFSSSATGATFEMNFVVEGQLEEIRMARTLVLSDSEAFVNCSVLGAGIIQGPQFMVQDHLREGRLVELLPAWKPMPIPVFAVYPHSSHLATKVRVFVDWIAEIFENSPLLNEKGIETKRLDPMTKKRVWHQNKESVWDRMAVLLA